MKQEKKEAMFTGAFIIIALAVGGFVFRSCYENKAKRDVKKAEEKRTDEATRSAISAMVSRTGANDDWMPSLIKGSVVRFGPILTVELERLWLQNRPVLFVGFIKDIATCDESHYTVVVEMSGSNYTILDTELNLSLRATKSRIDSSLEEHPGPFNDFGSSNDVAVIANIKAIQTTNIKDGSKEVRTGVGELVDILFSGNVRY